MKDDFEMIVWKLGRELEELHLYPLGDVHSESENFDEEQWKRWKETVFNDPLGYVVIVGDIFEVALKGSKGNSYETKHRIRDRKIWLAKELKPIKDRILGIARGNHEYRAVYSADDCPLYDVASKLDIEDLYRENMCFIKLSFGARRSDRQVTYTIVLAHGATDKKCENFSYVIDGMDIFITGHTHTPKETYPAKIVIDPHNDKVSIVGYKHMVVPSFMKVGGYTLRNMYLPQDTTIIPHFVLSGKEKKIKVVVE